MSHWYRVERRDAEDREVGSEYPEREGPHRLETCNELVGLNCLREDVRAGEQNEAVFEALGGVQGFNLELDLLYKYLLRDVLMEDDLDCLDAACTPVQGGACGMGML